MNNHTSEKDIFVKTWNGVDKGSIIQEVGICTLRNSILVGINASQEFKYLLIKQSTQHMKNIKFTS